MVTVTNQSQLRKQTFSWTLISLLHLLLLCLSSTSLFLFSSSLLTCRHSGSMFSPSSASLFLHLLICHPLNENWCHTYSDDGRWPRGHENTQQRRKTIKPVTMPTHIVHSGYINKYFVTWNLFLYTTTFCFFTCVNMRDCQCTCQSICTHNTSHEKLLSFPAGELLPKCHGGWIDVTISCICPCEKGQDTLSSLLYWRRFLTLINRPLIALRDLCPSTQSCMAADYYSPLSFKESSSKWQWRETTLSFDWQL